MIRGIREGIDGLKEIRILGATKYFRKIVSHNVKEFSDVRLKVQLVSTAPRYVLELVLMTLVVIMVMVSVILFKDLDSMVSTLAVFGVAALRLVPSVNVMMNSVGNLHYGRDSVSRMAKDLGDYYLGRLNVNEKYGGKNELVPFQKLTLDTVSFRYLKSGNWDLDNLTMTVKAGEAIGLVGPSGAGKTTLVDLLLGLLEPEGGSIQYNGHDLNSVMADWRSQVAYLPQDVFLIDATLRRNVALGKADDEIKDEEINQAIQQASLSEWVGQLPKGLNTEIGERGVRLSGGQRQRIALARAFFYGRNVLVMDEATSSLDFDTEKEIIEEIRRLKGTRTLIVIAHRITTVQHCDRIYRLDNGQIVDYGPPETMLNLKGWSQGEDA
jgi:ABC-type multidrug transport system fused ATPase/permease subunit